VSDHSKIDDLSRAATQMEQRDEVAVFLNIKDFNFAVVVFSYEQIFSIL
jgi:hypothetical protein